MEYIFTDDSYSTDNGCDCCEPTKFEAYNCELVPHTCHTERECYMDAIYHKMRSMPAGQLERVAELVGITVTIESKQRQP